MAFSPQLKEEKFDLNNVISPINNNNMATNDHQNEQINEWNSSQPFNKSLKDPPE